MKILLTTMTFGLALAGCAGLSNANRIVMPLDHAFGAHCKRNSARRLSKASH